MKNLVKITVATLILITAGTANILAGDMQCPSSPVPCFVGTPTVDEKAPAETKKGAEAGGIVFSLLERIYFYF